MPSIRAQRPASPRSTSPCCGPAARCATRSCSRRSASTPPIPPSGRRDSRSSPASSTSSRRWARRCGGVPFGRRDLVADEDNSLGGRVRRYARVSTAVGGIAARLAGERYLGMKLDRGRHAADLKAALGGIKGPLMKVAQLLATIPDALPDEYVRELIQLQANAPAMGWPFVKRRMMGELGPDWPGRFRSFEHEAARAASLGQVHRATALDGTPLAAKLQYPEMASAVEADLKQLRLAMGLYERYDRTVSTAAIHAEIADRLREELDYQREAAHMRLYREILHDEPGVAVPRPIPELSTRRLLTMTWLDGEPILEIQKA